MIIPRNQGSVIRKVAILLLTPAKTYFRIKFKTADLPDRNGFVGQRPSLVSELSGLLFEAVILEAFYLSDNTCMICACFLKYPQKTEWTP